MIKSQILDKKSICHALLSSTSSPEIFIPVKAVIEDVFFEENIPVYNLRVIKFYDNIHFLKEFLYETPYLTNYKGKSKPLKLPKISTTAELETWFSEKTTYRFCVESNFVVKTKIEMLDLFHRIQEYIIYKELRSIRRTIMRSAYEGDLKLHSKVEFSERIKRAFGDKFSNVEDLNSFIDSI
jgi:hypothetical protein